MSQDGALFHWAYVPRRDVDSELLQVEGGTTDARWRIINRHYFMQHGAKLRTASFHPASGLLVTGFSNGTFSLHELPEFNQVHSLRWVSQAANGELVILMSLACLKTTSIA